MHHHRWFVLLLWADVGCVANGYDGVCVLWQQQQCRNVITYAQVLCWFYFNCCVTDVRICCVCVALCVFFNLSIWERFLLNFYGHYDYPNVLVLLEVLCHIWLIFMHMCSTLLEGPYFLVLVYVVSFVMTSLCYEWSIRDGILVLLWAIVLYSFCVGLEGYGCFGLLRISCCYKCSTCVGFFCCCGLLLGAIAIGCGVASVVGYVRTSLWCEWSNRDGLCSYCGL